MEMMKNVAVKEDLVEMEKSLMKEVDANTKVCISEAVGPVKSELHELKTRVGALEIQQQQQQQQQQQGVDETLVQMVKAIENTIAELNIVPAQGSKNNSTAVVGG